jgi:hypothetical protein
MAKPKPNFIRLDSNRPEIAVLMAAMLHAREVVSDRSWASTLEPTTEYWWADVLADPRARTGTLRRGFYGTRGKPLARAHYTR